MAQAPAGTQAADIMRNQLAFAHRCLGCQLVKPMTGIIGTVTGAENLRQQLPVHLDLSAGIALHGIGGALDTGEQQRRCRWQAIFTAAVALGKQDLTIRLAEEFSLRQIVDPLAAQFAVDVAMGPVRQVRGQSVAKIDQAQLVIDPPAAQLLPQFEECLQTGGSGADKGQSDLPGRRCSDPIVQQLRALTVQQICKAEDVVATRLQQRLGTGTDHQPVERQLPIGQRQLLRLLPGLQMRRRDIEFLLVESKAETIRQLRVRDQEVGNRFGKGLMQIGDLAMCGAAVDQEEFQLRSLLGQFDQARQAGITAADDDYFSHDAPLLPPSPAG